MKLINLIIILLITLNYLDATPANDSIIEHVEYQLPHYGTLKESKGFVYVDVDDAYIHELIEYIRELGFETPPYFGNDLGGAHISVIYRKEGKQPDEIGEVISFIPKECRIVQPSDWKEMAEVYILEVEAKRLDEIREKYGLPKRKYEYHITIAVKPLNMYN